jgi:hypothetical protein
MSDRYTRRHAQAALERLAQACKLPISTGYRKPGLRLEYAACYGGYQLHLVRPVERSDDTGTPYPAEDLQLPFGYRRMKVRELVEAVRFVLDAIAVRERESVPVADYPLPSSGVE